MLELEISQRPPEPVPLKEARPASAHSSAFFFWKGRVALYAILKAMGVGPGDEVIVPGFTCVVVPQAVRFAGATPVYADIEETTLNLNPKEVDALISTKTKAIVVQHTFGLPANVEAIKEVASFRNIKIIEDCAHVATPLSANGGVGRIGNAAFFSTQWSKPVTTGLGGIAIANDASLNPHLDAFSRQCRRPSKKEVAALFVQFHMHRMLFKPSVYWRARDALHLLARLGLFLGSSSSDELRGPKPQDYEKRMGAMQLKAFRTAIAGIEANSTHRRFVTARYVEAAKRIGLPTIDIPRSGSDPVLLRYPVLVAQKNKVLAEARRQRVEIGDWFVSPLHPLTADFDFLGYRSGQCPVGESVSQRIINLPTHTRVDDRTVERICNFLRRV